MENWQGYIYLIRRDLAQFSKRSVYEWLAYSRLEVDSVLSVQASDLPRHIKLLDNYEQYP